MNSRLNLTRYSELMKKETALANKKKSLFSENRSEFLELLNYTASVTQQMMDNRKNDYFSLINNYLNQLITPSEFRTEFLKMEKQDGRKGTKILQDFQQLEVFSLAEDLEEFSNLMDQISGLCFDFNELWDGTIDRMRENEFYSLINNCYLQLQKSFED